MSLDVTVSDWFVSVFVTVTVAPFTAAPEASLIVPSTLALNCACAAGAIAITTSPHSTTCRIRHTSLRIRQPPSRLDCPAGRRPTGTDLLHRSPTYGSGIAA